MPMDIRRAMREQPRPLDFVLPGLLGGTVGSIVSPGGAGKSMLALELSLLVATRHDMVGLTGDRAYPTGRVVLLAAEDPPDAIAHRLYSLARQINNSIIEEQFAEQMTIVPLVGKQADVFEKDWFEYVMAMATGTRLLFLDTLRRFHQTDENDSGAMAILIGRLEAIAVATGCSIVFLHHASKAAALAGQGDQQQASRGSSVLVDNVRWQMFLAGMTRDQAKAHAVDDVMRVYWVREGVSKQNYGPPVTEVWLRRVEGGVLVPGHLGAPAARVARVARRAEA